MLEALGEWMGFPALLHRLRRQRAAALGRASRHHRALRPVQGAATASTVFLSVQNEREFARFLRSWC